MKKFLFAAILVLFLPVFLLVVAEAVTRVLVPRRAQVVRWDQVSLAGLRRVKSEAYANFPWALEFYEQHIENDRRASLVYEPFSLWKHAPLSAKYENYDESGYRRTVNPDKPNAEGERTVWVLGGSGVAGDGILRDEDVITSQLSSALNAMYPRLRIRVTNYAQSGFNQGNEFVLFTRRLAAGERPDLVIFHDGYNDVFHAVYSGYPHMAYQEFNHITALWAGSSSLREVMKEQIRRSRFVSLFLPKPPPSSEAKDKKTIDERAVARANMIAGQLVVARAIGRELGFPVLFSLQPTLFRKKALSAEEQGLLDHIRATFPLLERGMDKTYALMRSLELPASQRTFLDLEPVMAEAPSVYVDCVHMSPLGNQLMAQAMAKKIKAENLLVEARR